MHQEFVGLSNTTAQRWKSYRSWNQAICDHFFSGRYASMPVYLDMDGDVLKKLHQEEFGDGTAPEIHLRNAIKQTLEFSNSGNSHPFSAHIGWAEAWKRNKFNGAPPCLALLGYFSHIADLMIASENFGSNNYYGRLIEDLQIEQRYEELIKVGYQDSVSTCWQMLNAWLDSWNGTLGYPTARPLDHRRFVSVSISQALVRDHDRKLMRRMFGDLGLTPAQNFQANEMTGVLLHWASVATNQTSSLARLLGKGPAVFNRVVEVAQAELLAWNGQMEVKSGTNTAPRFRLSVVADLRHNPVPAMDLYLSVWSHDELLTQYEYRWANLDDPQAKIAFNDLQGHVRMESVDSFSFLSLEPWDQIRAGDALLANIELDPKINTKAPKLFRNGQPICILCYRDEEGIFREVPQAPLMARLMVLCHDSVATKVNTLLQKSARPGFKMMTPKELGGLPNHWTAFCDVHICSRVETPGLEALVPLADQTLILSGGFKVGNEIWLSCALPEVLVAETSGQQGIKVSLLPQFRMTDSEAIIELGEVNGAAAYDLNKQKLADGDYQIVMRKAKSGGKEQILAQVVLKIRSSDMARPEVLIAKDFLRHRVNEVSPWGILSATQVISQEPDASNEMKLSGAHMTGAYAPKNLAMRVARAAQELMDGETEFQSTTRATLPTETTNSGSCVARGYHTWGFDAVPVGAPSGFLVRAVCSSCQAVHWQRTRGNVAARVPEPVAARSGQVQVSKRSIILPPLREHCGSEIQTEIWEALNYWQVGSAQQVRSVIAMYDDRPWAMFEYLREMAALCHLDLNLSPKNSKIEKWSISPSCLVAISDTDAKLTGCRPQSLLRDLKKLVKELGGSVEEQFHDGKFPVTSVNGLTSNALRTLAEQLSIELVNDFSRNLVLSLPHIGSVAEELETLRLPSQNIEFFHLENAKWTPANKVDRPGAYRVQNHGNEYVFVPLAKVGTQSGYICDVRTAKFLAGLEQHKFLVGYNAGTRELVVPFGCELPGLFERAAVMCSGSPPIKSNGKVLYPKVSREIADAIFSRLN